jgi:hypothetical protein
MATTWCLNTELCSFLRWSSFFRQLYSEQFDRLVLLSFTVCTLGAMTTITPGTSWWVRAVVALCEAGLGFVCFDLHNDVAEDGKGEDSL